MGNFNELRYRFYILLCCKGDQVAANGIRLLHDIYLKTFGLIDYARIIPQRM